MAKNSFLTSGISQRQKAASPKVVLSKVNMRNTEIMIILYLGKKLFTLLYKVCSGMSTEYGEYYLYFIHFRILFFPIHDTCTDLKIL